MNLMNKKIILENISMSRAFQGQRIKNVAMT